MSAYLATSQFTLPHTPFIFYAAVVLWMVAMKLSAMDTETLERLLAHAVVEALHMAQLSRKEAAALMGVDYAQFGRQLRAEPGAHFNLTKLMRLAGTSFWVWFGPALILLVARERYAEFAETLSFFGRKRYGQPVPMSMPVAHEDTQRHA